MSSKGSVNKSGDMNPDLSREVPDTPDRIQRLVNPQRNQRNQDNTSRNARLGLNLRIRPPTINPSSLTNPIDTERKRKFCLPGISIPGSSNHNSRCNKKGKNVVQEVGEERNRGPAVRDSKGKAKLDVPVNNNAVQEKKPDQPNINSPKRQVGQRFLVRNGMISPSNTAKVSAQPPSAVLLREFGERVPPQPAASRSIGGAGDNAIINEIVSDDLHEGLNRSRRGLGASTSTSTSSWRSTHSNRPGRFNRACAGSSRPNPAVSTASIPVAARPTSRATLPDTTEGTGARPRPTGRIRSAASPHEGESSSRTPNPGFQPIDLTTPVRSRVRSSRVQRAEAGPIIDLDEIHSPDPEAAVRARQLAHDEMVARELQEQFYNEMPVDWSMEEMDASIAMALQREENAMRASPVAPRAPWPERSTQFMAASSLVRNNSAEQMHLDFNTDDYEALLALDEDNYRNTGSSTSQINSLPESAVKSGNGGEPCVVCLETPSVGEKIRHLPCFHKFHKDCIDQWLRRKKECPVCKCDIF